MCRSGQQNAHEFGGCIRRGSFVRALSILDEALGMPLKGTWDCWRQVVSSDGSKRQLPSRQREGAGVWSSVKRYSPFEFVDLPLSRMPEGGRLTRPAAYFRRFAQLRSRTASQTGGIQMASTISSTIHSDHSSKSAAEVEWRVRGSTEQVYPALGGKDARSFLARRSVAALMVCSSKAPALLSQSPATLADASLIMGT